MTWKTSTMAAAAAMALALPAHAAVIPGLFNTGTDSNNVALGADNQLDPHYSILSSTSPGFAGNQAVTFSHPAYVGNDADSGWLSLTSSGSPGFNTTVFRMSFDMTGLDLSTAEISGALGADNFAEIYLNGQSTGVTADHFQFLKSFSFSGGFVAGVNTFDILLIDTGPPGAFRLDDLHGVAGLAGPSGGVPEPATWAMMILGFGAAGAMLRRRRLNVA